MMRSETEIQDLVLNYCRTSALSELVNGFYDKKPAGVQDAAVVSVSDTSTGEFQSAFVYVIIYVPDIKVGGELTKNIKRVRELERVCMSCLESHAKDDWRFELIGQTCQQNDDATSHFISNRLLLTIYNE